jgi:hypothetical protein
VPVTRRGKLLRLGVLALVLGFVLSNFDNGLAQSSTGASGAERTAELEKTLAQDRAEAPPGVQVHLHGDQIHYHVLGSGADAVSAEVGTSASNPERLSKKARGLVFKGLRRAHRKGSCRGGYRLKTTPRKRACTHGPDAAPADVDVRETPSTAELRENTAQAADVGVTAALPCYGDGSTGLRVQAIYARTSDVPDRSAEIATLIPAWAANVDSVFARSAAETGGVRHVRWVTNADCTLAVQSVQLSSGGNDSLNNTISELKALGFNRPDRKYLVWADAATYCGIGEILGDDRADAVNANNYGPSFARVDSSCWGRSSSVEAHELMHTMGGTQMSAPHSSGGWHCLDENDRMCLADSPQAALSFPCPSEHEDLFDCGHDDYFSTAPPAGSYLATHWNSANSVFLSADLPESCSTTGQAATTQKVRHRHKRHRKVRTRDSGAPSAASGPCVPQEAFA